MPAIFCQARVICYDTNSFAIQDGKIAVYKQIKPGKDICPI